MLSVKARFANGVAQPVEPVEGREGQPVIITFVQEESTPSEPSPTPMDEEQWDEFERILEECQVETGITDLAHQHDHYLYGTAKKSQGDA